MTTVTLLKDLEDWARAEVAAGRAASLDDLVTRALSERRAEVEHVRGKLDEARASLEQGEGIDGDVFLAELESEAEAERRLR